MYTKPDFLKVSVKARDVFAPYGCPMDGAWQYTIINDQPCNDVDNTYVGMGYAHMCYSTDTH